MDRGIPYCLTGLGLFWLMPHFALQTGSSRNTCSDSIMLQVLSLPNVLTLHASLQALTTLRQSCGQGMTCPMAGSRGVSSGGSQALASSCPLATL